MAEKINSLQVVVHSDSDPQYYRLHLNQPASQLMFQICTRNNIKTPSKYFICDLETKKPVVLLRTLQEQNITYNSKLALKKKTGFQVKREQVAIGNIRKKTGGTNTGKEIIFSISNVSRKILKK